MIWKARYFVVLASLPLTLGSCQSRKPEAKLQIIAEVQQVVPVDSEHGVFNGLIGPKIIYDVYANVEDPKWIRAQLLVTQATEVYEQDDAVAKQVSPDTLKAGQRLRAKVSGFDANYPSATAFEIVIFK